MKFRYTQLKPKAPQHQILKLRNLIADYSVQGLVRGKQCSIIDSFFIDNSLKIVNCKLKIASGGGA